MRFRFVEARPEPAERFALDEVLLQYAGQTGEGVIALYRMSQNTISIGRKEPYADVKSAEIGVVRRPSTGNSVVHNDLGGDFSYSIALPMTAMPRRDNGLPDVLRFRDAYGAIPVREALRSLDIDAQITGNNNIMVGDLKISGGAYAGRRGVYGAGLEHGFVACDEEGRPLWDRLLGSGSDRVAFASSFGVTPEEAYRAVREAFFRLGDTEERPLSGAELQAAQAIAQEVYRSSSWTREAQDPRGIWSVKNLRSVPPCVEWDRPHPGP